MGKLVLSNIIRAARLIASSGPRFGTFFLNTDCNRRCSYCVVPDRGTGIEMSYEKWCLILDKMNRWGVRFGSFLGGEPTLRKDLPEILKYASKKMAVSLTSNGDTMLGAKGRDRLSNLASNGLNILNLSLHDLAETDRQLETLAYAKRLGIIPILATVVTRATIKALPAIMEKSNAMGILYRYSLYQSVGGAFSAQVDNLAPTKEEIENFISIVKTQKKRFRLVQNTHKYLMDGTAAYPRGWHCNSYEDHWLTVDNEGRLMACSEYPTNVSVLDLPSLGDSKWTEIRTAKRMACDGCTYQCYIDEEGLSRGDLAREGFLTAVGLLRAPITQSKAGQQSVSEGSSDGRSREAS